MIDDKALVEKDWINLFDSIEPLKEPLSRMSKSERSRIKYKEYNEEYRSRPEMKERRRKYKQTYLKKKRLKDRFQ